jgi:hypothetical protein
MYRAAHTPLEHDAAGNLCSVRWNNDDRSALRRVPYEDVPRLYDAMHTWNQLITSQDSEYWVQLSPGTIIGMGLSHICHNTPSPLSPLFSARSSSFCLSSPPPPLRIPPNFFSRSGCQNDTANFPVQRSTTTVYFMAALLSQESVACAVRTSEQTSSVRDWPS